MDMNWNLFDYIKIFLTTLNFQSLCINLAGLELIRNFHKIKSNVILWRF